MYPLGIKEPPQYDLRSSAGIIFVVAVTCSFVVGLFFVDRNQAVDLVIRTNQQLSNFVIDHPYIASACFFGAYVLFTSLSLPGSMFLSLAGGALFGVLWGVLLISFAATTGASLSFLVSRHLLRESMTAKYGHWLESFNREIDQDGIFDLLSLRLNPVVPFFLINIVFGLTRMRLRRFWWVTQLGMLPANFIFTYAGRELAASGVSGNFLNWKLGAALVALSIFPVLMRKLARAMMKRRRPASSRSTSEMKL